jgi:hypothetical protein
MLTWVCWTHFDCEVYVSFHSTKQAAYLSLRDGWLDECDPDDCGHVPEEMEDIDQIADALSYHWEEMSYEVSLREVLLAQEETTSESIIRNSKLLEQSADPSSLPAPSGDVLAALHSFQEES